MRLVTFIESNPGFSDPGLTDPALDEVRTALKDPIDVGFVGELALKVSTIRPTLAPGERCILQIVGHGSPGQLSVGAAYENRYESARPHRHFFLDSNPFVYGVLNGQVAAPTEVWLIGCSVGEDPPRPCAIAATGSTLVFALAQMWGCTVRASTGVINKRDFDAGGLFKHEDRLVAVKPTLQPTEPQLPTFTQPRWSVSRRARVVPLPTGSNATELVQLLRLLKAPAAGHDRPGAVDVQGPPGSALGNAYDRLLVENLGELLAIPEYAFAARWNGMPGTAEILLNGRLLRFRTGTTFHDFVFSATGCGAATVQEELLKLPVKSLGV